MSSMPDHVQGSLLRLVKLSYMSKALDMLLSPLKRLSSTGVRLVDPVGTWWHVYPRLLSYVMDLPESKDVFMVKGIPATHPCEACMVRTDDLHDILPRPVYRTVEQQKAYYKEMASIVARPDVEGASGSLKRKRQKKEDSVHFKRQAKSVLYCTHPVPCPLFGFEDQEDDDICSVLKVLGHESLHNEDIGVFLYLIDYLDQYFDKLEYSARHENSLYKKMNDRLEAMPRAGMLLYHSNLTNHL